MSTYQGIRGLKVRDYTTNPDNPLEGQLWYNKTDSVGKYQVPIVTTVGAWRTANPANTARALGSMVGAQTSSLFFGGWVNPPSVRQGVTESYNGTTFTEVNDLNTARSGLGGAGTANTAALAIAGQTGGDPGANSANVESWNGAAWTEITDVNQGRYGGGSAGTTTSALAFAGYQIPTGYVGITESWNGSAWTEVADLNDARGFFSSSGASNTLALGFGGDSPGNDADTESWNGSAWTEVNNLNTARFGSHLGIIGTYIDTLCVGGYD